MRGGRGTGVRGGSLSLCLCSLLRFSTFLYGCDLDASPTLMLQRK
jgi:hypothetical protein